jgi:hypothetical protein
MEANVLAHHPGHFGIPRRGSTIRSPATGAQSRSLARKRADGGHEHKRTIRAVPDNRGFIHITWQRHGHQHQGRKLPSSFAWGYLMSADCVL